jgi:hypothetical protein
MFCAEIFNQTSSDQLRHMPLDLDNGLPGIEIVLGDVAFLCHVDSCAAMSTGNTLVHMWIMSTYPEIVVDYCEHNDPIPFQPLSLRCAIDKPNPNEPSQQDLSNCLTKVVTYRTKYTLNGKPALIQFGLGDNVAVRSILGIPFLRTWGCDILLSRNCVIANAIGVEFPIEYAATSSSLPPGISFRKDDFVRPQSASSSAFVSTNSEHLGITDGCYDGVTPSLFPQSFTYSVTETINDGIVKRVVETIAQPDTSASDME